MGEGQSTVDSDTLGLVVLNAKRKRDEQVIRRKSINSTIPEPLLQLLSSHDCPA